MVEDDKYWILLSRYVSEGLSPVQTEELLRWINDNPHRIKLLQEAQTAWGRSDDYQKVHLSEIDTESAWSKVRAQMQTTAQPAKEAKIRTLRWMSIAASLLLFCSLSWYGYQTYDQSSVITIANHHGGKQEVVLPDGSTVWLNNGGTLSYKKGLAKLDKREVSLEGEAFFEVKHDPEKPFIVRTGALETQVLGTSFNVASDERGIVKVAVITGKVSFKKAEGNGIFLLPGEKGDYHPSKGISKTGFKNTNFLYWKDQTLNFENEKLSFVLQEIERAYHIKFKINDENLLNQEITTSFKAASVEEVVAVLENLLDLNIARSGAAYIVVK